MNKEKRIWIALFLVLTLMLILSGCTGLPKVAQLSMVADPNPVPYTTEDGKWHYMMYISESNGVGVTVSSLTFTRFNQENELTGTTILDATEFYDWFETDYIPAFSTIQNGIVRKSFVAYSIVRVAGIDDKANPVEATVRIDYLPK